MVCGDKRENDDLNGVSDDRLKAHDVPGPAIFTHYGDTSLITNTGGLVYDGAATALAFLTENKIGFARQFYNDIATRFNTAQQVFPANLFAGMLGFKPAELFEVTKEADREVPMVDLSRKAPTA